MSQEVLGNGNEFWSSNKEEKNEEILQAVLETIKNGSGKRFYVVAKDGVLIGVFSNRKIMLGALVKSGIELCHIKGARINKQVNTGSIATGFEEGVLKIYQTTENNEEVLKYKVWEITLNKLNPEFFKE